MKPGQSLSGGAAGICLLRIEQARQGTGTWDAVNASLREAVADGASVADSASLYFGAPALSFVLHAAAGRPGIAEARAALDTGSAILTRRRLEAANLRIDRSELPQLAEYDLIGGLTGLGVVLRRSGNLSLFGDVLRYLVRLCEPIGGLPGWWCPAGPNRNQAGPAGGHSNHGIAHGIAGPLALLALGLNDGVEVDGQAEAIFRISRWLDTWEQRAGSGSWWPEIVTLNDLSRVRTSQPGPLRPSWCYGTPGIARAQQLAARALDDRTRQHKAESAFLGCVTDTTQLGRLTSRGLCHGTAGLLATARRIAADALNPIPVQSLLRLHQHATPAKAEPPGFLDGTAGADLVLAGTANPWDACLLLC
jgi:hypothetical protein